MSKSPAQQLAEDYGWALAFLKSDKSLWNKFQSAVKGHWGVERFQAEIKNTSWYKHNSETARQDTFLRTNDHATWLAKRASLGAQIKDAAAQLGGSVSGTTITRIAENAMKYGWNEAQIRDTLSSYVKAVNGVYGGSTGNDIESVRQTAYRNGVRLSKATEASWAHKIASGNTTAETLQRQVRQMAKSLAPGYAQELDAGVDLQDIVSPYIESKAKLLELNPADIDLFDKDIRSAISGTTKDGKPASKSLWQFENEIRQSKQWLGTQNAQDSTMSVAHKVLQDMGFAT